MKPLARLRSQLGTRRALVMAAGLGGVAVWFRLWQLDAVPPGLHPIEAAMGLKAQAGQFMPGFKAIQQSLSLVLIAVGQKLTGNRILGLRLGPALAGIVSVWFFYHWLALSYGRRVAQIGTLLFATLPWPLYLTRFGSGYALAMMFMTASLYLLGSSWQRKGSRRAIVMIVVISLGLYSHPSYNWFLLGLLVAGLVNLRPVLKFRQNMLPRLTIGGLVALLAPAPAAPALAAYAANAARQLGSSVGQLVTVGQLFFLKSPLSYDFNLQTLPLLNAFAGLMLLLGLLHLLGQLKRPVNRTVISLFAAGLIGFVLLPANSPLADRTLALVIPAVALAAIGVNYLLNQWLSTFPQNSAARNVGTLMIVVLLLFSVRHSYSQYFLAWRASTGVKDAYSRRIIQALSFVGSQSFDGERFIVGRPDDLTVAEYLTKNSRDIRLLEPGGIRGLDKLSRPRQFIVLRSVRDEAIAALADKFPGGKLKPELESGKQEKFLVYTVKP